MHMGINGARLVMLPRVGHLGNLENPPGFTNALGMFLSDTWRAGL
jgi:pimeloyl-ACP methyl ester carboxylesterase